MSASQSRLARKAQEASTSQTHSSPDPESVGTLAAASPLDVDVAGQNLSQSSSASNLSQGLSYNREILSLRSTVDFIMAEMQDREAAHKEEMAQVNDHLKAIMRLLQDGQRASLETGSPQAETMVVEPSLGNRSRQGRRPALSVSIVDHGLNSLTE